MEFFKQTRNIYYNYWSPRSNTSATKQLNVICNKKQHKLKNKLEYTLPTLEGSLSGHEFDPMFSSKKKKQKKLCQALIYIP